MTEGKDDKNKDYSPVDWAPKFLQPVLQQIVLTGKSMEMLEGLGKLAESESGKSLDLVGMYWTVQFMPQFFNTLHAG